MWFYLFIIEKFESEGLMVGGEIEREAKILCQKVNLVILEGLKI